MSFYRSCRGALAAMLISVLAACATPKDYSNVKEYKAQTLSGRVAGQDWTYKYAYIDPTAEAPEEDDFVFVFLPYKPKHKCPRADSEESQGDGRVVMVSAPAKLKHQTMLKPGSARTLVFQFDKKNGEHVAEPVRFGKMKLTSLGKGMMKGKLVGNLDANNWINGSFSVRLCDLKSMQPED